MATCVASALAVQAIVPPMGEKSRAFCSRLVSARLSRKRSPLICSVSSALKRISIWRRRACGDSACSRSPKSSLMLSVAGASSSRCCSSLARRSSLSIRACRRSLCSCTLLTKRWRSASGRSLSASSSAAPRVAASGLFEGVLHGRHLLRTGAEQGEAHIVGILMWRL